MPDPIKHRHTARLRPAILSVMRSCACEVWSEEALRFHLRATTPVWMLRTALDILIEEGHVRRVIGYPTLGTGYALTPAPEAPREPYGEYVTPEDAKRPYVAR